MKIFCVGVLTRDIVLYVDRYPNEDESIRTTDQSVRIGGNAANNCQVIEELRSIDQILCKPNSHRPNISSVLLASMSNHSTTADLIKQSNKSTQSQISVTDAVKSAIFSIPSTGQSSDKQNIPTSYIICSRSTGSRTIVHHRGDVPELTFNDFTTMLTKQAVSRSNDQTSKQSILPNINTFDCIHWEGRPNVESIRQMIFTSFEQRRAFVRALNHQPSTHCPLLQRPLLTLEIEKTRPKILELAQSIDCLFLSKEYCLSISRAISPSHIQQINGPVDFLEIVWPIVAAQHSINQSNKLIVVPWGSLGAALLIQDSSSINQPIIHVSAIQIDHVIDSVGAGDTFIGAFLYAALLSEHALLINQSNRSIQLQTNRIYKAILSFACGIAGEKCTQVGVAGMSIDRVKPYLLKLITEIQSIGTPKSTL